MNAQRDAAEPDHSTKAPQSTALARHQPDSCTICLEPITERAITAPCTHALFDYLCLLTWLLEHDARCPLCKTEVTSVSYDFVSVDDVKIFRIPKQPDETRNQSDSPGHVRFPRRSGRRPYRSPSPPPRDAALAFRERVYRHQLYSLHIGANNLSNYRNFTACDFASSPEMQTRARKWLRRELKVFGFLGTKREGNLRSVPNAEFLLEYIMALLRNVDIKDSGGKAEDILREFLGRTHARLFLHELEAWLRSPFEHISDWDNITQYPQA